MSDQPHIQVNNVTVENITISPGLGIEAGVSAVKDFLGSIKAKAKEYSYR